ncbi:MAG: hypothetical protein SF123_14235 [Chloroflexota bacterium]|nr:hypothetical protein [Chloroflexota bacterium]
MSFTPYQLTVLIPSGVKISLDEIQERLVSKFARRADVTIERTTDSRISIFFGSWLYTIAWQSNALVIVESQDIATLFAAKRSDQAVIASSDRRISAYGSSDPGMDHFNDFVFIAELLEALPEVYIFDPVSAKLWKSGEVPD